MALALAESCAMHAAMIEQGAPSPLDDASFGLPVPTNDP
jgi:hypothetical protein